MSNTKLAAQPRNTTGSPAARRLRAEGHIPGVIYGQGMTPVSVTVERRELRLALSGPAGSNTVLTLEVDGKSYPAVVKEMQRHPIRRTVAHIDFLQVNMNEEITVSVAVHLTGEAKAVAAEGGLVDAAVDTIEVSCTPNNMPMDKRPPSEYFAEGRRRRAMRPPESCCLDLSRSVMYVPSCPRAEARGSGSKID